MLLGWVVFFFRSKQGAVFIRYLILMRKEEVVNSVGVTTGGDLSYNARDSDGVLREDVFLVVDGTRYLGRRSGHASSPDVLLALFNARLLALIIC